MRGVTRRVVYVGAFAMAVLGVACSLAFPLDVFQSGGAPSHTSDEAGVIDLVTVYGYFAMVCAIMNVAHTPAPDGRVALCAFPP